jgi:hypothetical protein
LSFALCLNVPLSNDILPRRKIEMVKPFLEAKSLHTQTAALKTRKYFPPVFFFGWVPKIPLHAPPLLPFPPTNQSNTKSMTDRKNVVAATLSMRKRWEHKKTLALRRSVGNIVGPVGPVSRLIDNTKGLAFVDQRLNQSPLTIDKAELTAIICKLYKEAKPLRER